MAKRSANQWDSELENEDEFLEEEIIPIQVKQEPPASVWLQCVYPATVIVTGITGKRYVFNGSGSTCEVDAIDVPKLMEKKFNQTSCCGKADPTPKFRRL